MPIKVETLDVVVEKVRFPKAGGPDPARGESTWHILATDKGSAKGEMSWRPQEGERLTLSGCWSVYQGSREFKFSVALPNIPVDQRDALHYAAERTLGIGPALEQGIWDVRGGHWQEIGPGEVKRLDGELYLRFRETVDALCRESEKSQVIAWLIGRGATVAVACAAWDAWGLQTMGVVAADPYRIDELAGYGFTYVDRSIRLAFEIGDADPRRIRAAVRYAMGQYADDGHTAVSWDNLRERANEILSGLWTQAIADQVRAMFGNGTLRPWESSRRLSLGRDAEAAEAIWDYAAKATPAAGTPFDAPPPAAVGSVGSLDDSQLAAIAFACSVRLAIVTGGAGTGKTTIVKQIAGQVGSPLLCAFAGKAAARLREATGMDASTIHRMLGFNGTRFCTTTLAGKTVIVDEASMIDEALLAEILRKQPSGLVLVGDEAQLPPVGRGQPFHDLIRLRPDLVRRLTRCYRQTEAVFQASTLVREGKMPALHLQSAGETWDILATGDAVPTEDAILAMAAAGDIDFARDLIITPRNGEGDDAAPATVKSLNLKLREVANPRHGEVRIDVGDRVICTKNLPDLDCWNGTTGTVSAVDDANQIWVRLDIPAIGPSGEPVSEVLFDREVKKHLQLAYALTVHKSQGSQYRRIIVVCLSRDGWGLLDRALLYTAVTRAKAQCTVVGQPRAFQDALARVGIRLTALQEVAAMATVQP